jgi:hypothetical protein
MKSLHVGFILIKINEKNITHLHPIFYDGLLTFPMHVCMLQVIVVCYFEKGPGGGTIQCKQTADRYWVH